VNEKNQDIASDIEAAYDGRWGVWQSDTGQWWAARTQTLTAREQSAGSATYLRADTPDELSQAIANEERLTDPPEEGR
jgi:hypothetical protein